MPVRQWGILPTARYKLCRSSCQYSADSSDRADRYDELHNNFIATRSREVVYFERRGKNAAEFERDKRARSVHLVQRAGFLPFARYHGTVNLL